MVAVECGCGGGLFDRHPFTVPTMTAARNSKAEARRRAREATRRANEARAARDRANIEDAATFLHALGKIEEIEIWKKERLAQLRAQVADEAGRRVDTCRRDAGAAVARMQGRGDKLAAIAEKLDTGIGVVRTMLRHAPKDEKTSDSSGSHALGVLDGGGGEAGGEPGGAAYPDTTDPDAATA